MKRSAGPQRPRAIFIVFDFFDLMFTFYNSHP